MQARRTRAGRAASCRGRKASARGEVDLDRVDAFLKGGVDALCQVETDPLALLKPNSADRPSPVPPPPPPVPSVQSMPVKPPPAEVEVSISKDRMEAFLLVRARGAAWVDLPQVMRALSQAGVKTGIDEDEILALIDRLPSTSPPEVRVLVAEGAPSHPAQPATVTVPAVQVDPLTTAQLTDLAAKADRLNQQLAGEQLERLTEGGNGLPLLLPGEVAVRLTPAVQGTPGMDVGGRELPPSPVAETLPTPGEGLESPTPDGDCLARVAGYLRLSPELATLIPPVWISEDEMAAYALLLAAPDRSLPIEAWAEMIRRAGIVHPPDLGELARRLQRTEPGPGAVLVSTGTAARPGEDGRVELQVPVVPRVGRFLEDGSIDFKSRGVGVSVEPDTLLAVVHPATAGFDGVTVRGRALSAVPGRPTNLEAGTGVEARPDGPVVRYFAQAQGCVRQQGQVLEVVPLLALPGDVDYATGNLDLTGNLTVEGVVRGGFEIKATGDVVVGQGLENGAVVRSGGAISVSRGVFGGKTRVVALSMIQAQFVHDASLVCKGDVEIGSYAYHSRIRAGGWVRVQGKGEHGGITGGEICGTSGILTASAGSESAAGTRLIAGIDPEVAGSLQKVEQGLEYCRNNTQKLATALRSGSTDPRVVAQTIGRAVPSDRPRLCLLARKLGELTRVAERLEQERERLQERQRQTAQEAQIRVDGTLHAGVDVFIGRAHLRVGQPLKRVVLRLAPDGRIEQHPAH